MYSARKEIIKFSLYLKNCFLGLTRLNTFSSHRDSAVIAGESHRNNNWLAGRGRAPGTDRAPPPRRAAPPRAAPPGVRPHHRFGTILSASPVRRGWAVARGDGATEPEPCRRLHPRHRPRHCAAVCRRRRRSRRARRARRPIRGPCCHHAAPDLICVESPHRERRLRCRMAGGPLSRRATPTAAAARAGHHQPRRRTPADPRVSCAARCRCRSPS
jgi:hypothetical protein